jgi:hypothetical protein
VKSRPSGEEGSVAIGAASHAKQPGSITRSVMVSRSLFNTMG